MTSKTTRRAVLAGAAVLPALTLPAIAAVSIDPAFAAIDRQKEAFAVTDVLAKCEPSPKSPECDAWEANYDPAHHAWSEAREDMLRTVPTTRAGALALIGALSISGDAEWDDEDAKLLLRTIAEALPNIT